MGERNNHEVLRGLKFDGYKWVTMKLFKAMMILSANHQSLNSVE